MGAAPSPPVQGPAIPPTEGEVPSQRRYPTRRPPADPVPPVDQATSPVSRPPTKRTRFSGPGEPSHAPQPEPATEEPQIPVENPTLIQFTIDGRQGAIGARHIAEALRIPYEPVFQADFRE